MKLERVSDGILLCDHVEYAKEVADMQLNALETTNNRTFVQPWGRLEWGFDVTLTFSSSVPTASLAKRKVLIRSIWRNDRLRFYFRDGSIYPVEVAAYEDEKDENAKVTEVYHVDLLLVRKDDAGFQTR